MEEHVGEGGGCEKSWLSDAAGWLNRRSGAGGCGGDNSEENDGIG